MEISCLTSFGSWIATFAASVAVTKNLDSFGLQTNQWTWFPSLYLVLSLALVTLGLAHIDSGRTDVRPRLFWLLQLLPIVFGFAAGASMPFDNAIGVTNALLLTFGTASLCVGILARYKS